MARDVVKVVPAWELIYLEDTPDRVVQAYYGLLLKQGDGLLELYLCLALYGYLEFAVHVLADVEVF